MSESNARDYQIKLLQENLCSIRKIAGWSAEILAGKIGCTRQSIHNLEHMKNPMTLMQYITIRYMIDYEIETSKNEVLSKVIIILLDKRDQLNDIQYSKIMTITTAIAAAASGGIDGTTLMLLFRNMINPIITEAEIKLYKSTVVKINIPDWFKELVK